MELFDAIFPIHKWTQIALTFQGPPKFNFKPVMVEKNAILLTSLILFEGEAFYQKDYSILDGIQRFSCKYFLFGKKEWPTLRTTFHVWSKGDILDLSSWEAQCTTAVLYIFAK